MAMGLKLRLNRSGHKSLFSRNFSYKIVDVNRSLPNVIEILTWTIQSWKHPIES